MKCNCKDWEENFYIVNGPLMMEKAINPQLDNDYKGKIFVYCPWCGSILLAQMPSAIDKCVETLFFYSTYPIDKSKIRKILEKHFPKAKGE